MLRSASFWIFAAIAVLLALQVFPYTGVVLMFFGAALITGALVHVFLIALLIEAAIGRVPRLFILVPVAAYGAYYALYLHQGIQIANKSAELRASNPGKVLQFDPAVHSLVMTEKMQGAQSLVARHEIPVAYETNPNYPERFLSYRLIRRDQCKVRRDTQGRIRTWGIFAGNRIVSEVCGLRVPEAPEHKVIEATERRSDEIWQRRWDIGEQTTTLTFDGKTIGTYRSASVWRLPAWPTMAIGCALISSTPAWKCGADFLRSHVVIDAVPDSVDRSRFDTPVSVMLGIRRYTDTDLASFKGFAENDAALARIEQEPDRIEQDIFNTLQGIIDGDNPKPAFNMGYAIAQNPGRLSAMADGIAHRFVALNAAPPNTPYRADQLRALATGLAALPLDVFPRVSRAVFDVFRNDRTAWNRFPALYIRAADAGPDTLPLYRDDFMSDRIKGYLRMLPVLAICRIGQADEALIAEMKARLLSSKNEPGRNFDYPSALMVALVKLGQDDFVRANAPALTDRTRGWVDAVLERKGVTAAGPNNCMMERWNSTDYLGPAMAPTLTWQRGAWIAADAGKPPN